MKSQLIVLLGGLLLLVACGGPLGEALATTMSASRSGGLRAEG